MTIRNAPADPILVSNQTITAPAWTSLRGVLIAIGAVLTSNGYVSESTAQTLIGVAMAVIPYVWGIVLSWTNKRKLITAAASADDAVATVI